MNAVGNWWRVSRLWKLVVSFWFLIQNDEDVLLFSHHTSSMKHHLTETHEHNFEIHNSFLSLQNISLSYSTQFSLDIKVAIQK